MSIGRKISLLLALLALVMVFQSVDRVMQLHQSARSFEVLAQRIERATSDVETLSRATGQVDLLARRIITATTPRDVFAFRNDAMDILADAQLAAGMLGGSEHKVGLIARRMEDLGAAVDALALSRSDALAREARIDRLRAELRSTARELRAELLPFQLGFLNALGDETETAHVEKDLRLLIGLSRLLSRLGDLMVSEATGQARAVQDDVARLVSNTVSILSTSNHLGNRAALAVSLAEVRDVLDALNDAGPALREGHAALSSAEAQLGEKLTEIGALVSGFVRAEEEDVRQVYSAAVEAAERELWSEIVINAGFGLGIVLAVWFVFARQISARLERLTNSVLRLADGDLSRVEPPQGNDELSRMTAALGVFRQNARELRRSNEELANFAYAASHDLRTPLRAIRDLVDWTIEDAGDDLDPAISRNLAQIRARAERLSRLLQDLLNYARAGQGDSRITSVDVSEMVTDILGILDPNETLEVRYLGEARVVTDAVPLRIILLNLIANAVKHRDRPNVLVTVSVESVEAGWAISVEDDGPGIPLRYQKKVFELFQTLESRDVVEGSGLGLAMVQKLATHLEGSIKLVSDPAVRRGTTFTLHIPKRDIPEPIPMKPEGLAA